MPFEKGNKLGKIGGGRKVYILEQKQVNKMRKLLDKDLAIAEKLQNAKKLDPLEEKKLQILQSRILKYADKLHATKEHTEVIGNLQVSIDPESLDKISKAIDDLL